MKKLAMVMVMVSVILSCCLVTNSFAIHQELYLNDGLVEVFKYSYNNEKQKYRDAVWAFNATIIFQHVVLANKNKLFKMEDNGTLKTEKNDELINKIITEITEILKNSYPGWFVQYFAQTKKDCWDYIDSSYKQEFWYIVKKNLKK